GPIHLKRAPCAHDYELCIPARVTAQLSPRAEQRIEPFPAVSNATDKEATAAPWRQAKCQLFGGTQVPTHWMETIAIDAIVNGKRLCRIDSMMSNDIIATALRVRDDHPGLPQSSLLTTDVSPSLGTIVETAPAPPRR